jgi:hypothetical protein
VPAPANGLISDFDSGTYKAVFGEGWFASGDDRQGGKSTATQHIVEGGAEGTKSALEVTGTLNYGAAYPSAGTTFFPNGTADDKTMDLSSKQSLTFWVRGDERSNFVVFITAGFKGGVPPMYPFTPQSGWRQIRVPLHELAGLDLKRVRLFTIITTGSSGDFKFQIDNVRFE